MIIGTISAIGSGGMLPIFAILWGEMTNSFGASASHVEDEAKRIMLIFIYIGLAALAVGWAMFACWMITG